MSVEVVFEKDAPVVLQYLANIGVNLEGQYLDALNDIYRIVVKQGDLPKVLSVLKMLGQNYAVSIAQTYTFAVGVPGQVAKVWQMPGVVATYNLEDQRLAVIYDAVLQQ